MFSPAASVRRSGGPGRPSLRRRPPHGRRTGHRRRCSRRRPAYVGLAGQVDPVFDGRQRRQRFLGERHAVARQPIDRSGGLGHRPCLVGVDHDGRPGTDSLAHRADERFVAVRVVADFHLEGVVPGGNELAGQRWRPRRIEGAGIDRDAVGRRPVQQGRQGLPAAPSLQIPHRHVEAGDAVPERTGLTDMGRHARPARLQVRPDLPGMGEALADQLGRDDGLQQLLPRRGGMGREVAPHLAPAERAAGILDLHEQPVAGAHRAETGRRQPARLGTQAHGLDPGNADGLGHAGRDPPLHKLIQH